MYKLRKKCNYYPTFILFPIFKILEKLIHIKTTKFFNKHSIILFTQYRFKSNYSILHALNDLLTKCYDNINNNNNYTALVLFNLKKAFDTVNHKILLNKLDRVYDVHGVAISLFYFLSNRFQYVSLENQQSLLKNINCEVPQRSVLGPLLLTVYRVSRKFPILNKII